MDPHPDVAAGPRPANPDQAPTRAPVACDQAIFTSIASPMGSGYRLVSASRGLRTGEKQHIVPRSPSHDGLADDQPDATGVSFYPLPTGRLCLAHTCKAGVEHTGRGGHRIYTRIVVLDREQFAAFGHNPFRLLRAMLRATGNQPDLQPPLIMPPLELEPATENEIAGLAESAEAIGGNWFAGLLTRLLRRNTMVLLSATCPQPLLEALMVSLPAPLRCELSFSVGLRFSLSRGFTVTSLDQPDPSRLRITLQGHDVSLLEPHSGTQKTPEPDCDWSRMALHRWQRGRGDALVAFTAGRFPDTSWEALQLYGRLCMRQDDSAEAEPAELVSLLGEHLLEDPDDELAVQLAIDVTNQALARLHDFFSTAPIDALQQQWHSLLSVWSRSEATAFLLAKLVGDVLMRATRLAPLSAAEMAVGLVQAVRNGTPVEPVERPIHDLLDHLGEWVNDQPADRLAALASVLKAWGPDGPCAARVRRLNVELSACRASAQTAA